jgi:large subunit ribosomal protein L15
MKGQKSRAGFARKAGFEGGQTPLYMRLPKGRGTKQTYASQVQKPVAVGVGHLQQFPDGSIVGPAALRQAGFLQNRHQLVKLVGKTRLDKKLIIRVHAISAGALQAVEAAGGKVEIIASQ